MRVFQVQMAYFDQIEKSQYVLLIAQEMETVVILSSLGVTCMMAMAISLMDSNMKLFRCNFFLNDLFLNEPLYYVLC